MSVAFDFVLQKDTTVALSLEEIKEDSVGPCSACQIFLAAVVQQVTTTYFILTPH